MPVPGVKKILAACEDLQAAANELRSAEHDEAVESIGCVSELLGSMIAKITIEHSRRTIATEAVS